MKITAVKVILLQKQLASSMRISRGGFSIRTHALVQVTTNEGLTGLGEGVGNARLVKAIVEGQMADLAIGLDPFNIERLRQRLMSDQVYFERQGSAICAASAIEMACWDIKGKALNLPVYQLLGGLYRDRIEAYASDVYWEEDPGVMAANAARIVEAGFRGVKAHIGCAAPRLEVARVCRLREAIGPEVRLMIDLNAGYTVLEAYAAADLWGPYDIAWLEEPLSPESLQALADLRAKIRIPIAVGENEFRTFGFKALFEQHALDVAMPDIGRVGGLQETKNICVLAESFGLSVSPHNYSSGVLLAATLHLMASTPNTQGLEIDTSTNAIYEELLTNPVEFRDGLAQVPSSPGLGVELRKETLKHYAVA